MDTPNTTAGPWGITNPRNNPNHFYSILPDFSQSALGLEGTANRRFFHGPGLNNWDLAVLKNTPINERIVLQFRAELFNMWNHTQFISARWIGLPA